jgi:hypothetical protein
VETRLTRDRDWIVLRFEGKGSAAEVKTAFLQALEEAKAEGVDAILLDTADSSVHPAFDEMRDLAHFAIALQDSRPPRTALVVGGSLQFGLARMFSSLVEFTHWEFRIFRSIPDAEAWLLDGADRPADPDG